MNDTNVSANRQKKEKLVAGYSDKVGRAKAMVFSDYKGMTHKQLEELKKGLKAANAELVVTKNTLLLRSLDEHKIKHNQEFNGPTATIFAYADVAGALKQLAKTIKSFNMPLVKFGIMDGQVLSEADVLKISTLPSREVLLAQLVGGMKSPIYGLHRALNWNLQKFVMTLKAIESKKPASS